MTTKAAALKALHVARGFRLCQEGYSLKEVQDLLKIEEIYRKHRMVCKQQAMCRSRSHSLALATRRENLESNADMLANRHGWSIDEDTEDGEWSIDVKAGESYYRFNSTESDRVLKDAEADRVLSHL